MGLSPWLRGSLRILTLLGFISESSPWSLDWLRLNHQESEPDELEQRRELNACPCGVDPSCDSSCDSGCTWIGTYCDSSCDTGCDYDCLLCPPPPSTPPSPPAPPSPPPPPSPPGGGAVYTRWGSTSCPSGSTLLYTGFMAGAHYQHGSGSNYLCMHPDPEAPSGANQALQDGSLVYGVEYQFVLRNTAIDASANHDQDAACALCQHEAAVYTYPLWCAANAAHALPAKHSQACKFHSSTVMSTGRAQGRSRVREWPLDTVSRPGHD
jgi:hypothetical protein